MNGRKDEAIQLREGDSGDSYQTPRAGSIVHMDGLPSNANILEPRRICRYAQNNIRHQQEREKGKGEEGCSKRWQKVRDV